MRLAVAAPPSRWRGLLTVPRLVAAAALTTLVGLGTTLAFTAVQQQLTARDPLTWTVQRNPALVGSFAPFHIEALLPAGSRPTTGPGPFCDGFQPWAHQHDGIDAGTTRLQIVLQGRSTSPLLITNARAVVVGEETPGPGIAVQCPPAGDVELRPLSIDLEGPGRQAVYESTTGRDFGFTLAEGEIESFLITATARTATYSWNLELTVVVGDESRTVLIDDGGRPFRTTQPLSDPIWQWDYEGSWTYFGVDESVSVPAGGDLAGGPP